MLTDRQIEQRRSGIGASECAIAAGLSPYATVVDLYNDKIYGITKTETPAMRAGNFFEDGVAKMYEIELGGGLVRDPDVKLRRCRTRRHPKHRWMLATIDREVYRHGMREKLAEIKLPASRFAWNPSGGERELEWGYAPDEIPAYIACQVQWQMAIANESRCDVVAYFLDKKEIAIYPQERNEQMIEALVEINRRFWFDHIVARVPPTLDGSEASSQLLKKLFPANVTGLSPAPAHAGELARDYELARRAQKDAEYEVERLGNMLKNLIGHADGMVGPWGKATWKLDSRGRLDYKQYALQLKTRLELLAEATGNPALADDLKQIEAECRGEPVRPLRVTYKLPLTAAGDDTKAGAA